MHCIVYDWWVTGPYAATMVPGWLYQASGRCRQKRSCIVGGNSTHARGTDGEYVGAGCPGAHQGAEGDCCAETGGNEGLSL